MTDPFKTIETIETIEMLAREMGDTLTRTKERLARHIEVTRAAKALLDANRAAEEDAHGTVANDTARACEDALATAVQALELDPENAAMQTPPAGHEMPFASEERSMLLTVEKAARRFTSRTEPRVDSHDLDDALAGLDKAREATQTVSATGPVGYGGQHVGHPDCPMTKSEPGGLTGPRCTCPTTRITRGYAGGAVGPEPVCTGQLVHDEYTLCPIHDHKDVASGAMKLDTGVLYKRGYEAGIQAAIETIKRMCSGPDKDASGWKAEAEYAEHDQETGARIVRALTAKTIGPDRDLRTGIVAWLRHEAAHGTWGGGSTWDTSSSTLKDVADAIEKRQDEARVTHAEATRSEATK